MNHRAVAAICVAGVLSDPVSAQVTQRVSVSTTGAQIGPPSNPVSITDSGRYVLFNSDATDAVPGDTNGLPDGFVRDREGGATERVSVGTGGVEGNGASEAVSITPDARLVVFFSASDNLVPGDSNGTWDVFVRDRSTNSTTLVSVDGTGAPGNSSSLVLNSYVRQISDDGRFVSFESEASNLVAGDTNGVFDVFVRDLVAGTTERVSVGAGGIEANALSWGSTISADGRYVAFSSYATNLVPGDTNGVADLFVRDRQSGTTERVSVSTTGIQASDDCVGASISGDGRRIAFATSSHTLIPADLNGEEDVYVRDRSLGTTEIASISTAGILGNGQSYGPTISSDGRFVVFTSRASNLIAGDSNGSRDVFLRDLQAATTELGSIGAGGIQGNGDSWSGCITADGRYATFSSQAFNLVPVDTNAGTDGFVRDRFGGTAFTSLCDPGAAGVITCPCVNPPNGPGRGCDNSSGTGGATLAASGSTSLSSDNLVFTTGGEKPTALSIVSQWNSTIASGEVFGMGVRCGAGTPKRLYTRVAAGGSITTPDLGAGDPQVSVRSAALGDPIAAGQARWYLVYYRDPVVLGGCPAGSTFNATQTGRINWAP